MAYEIPQQLQYEEKIIFNLTAKQLGYASATILPAFLIFLKSGLGFYIKIIIGAALIGIGSLFMFFDFSSYLKNLLAMAMFREVNAKDKKMMGFLGLNKIKDGIIYVNKTPKN